MSEEKDLPETAEPKESEPERKFSREHYDLLMEGQKPWLEFREAWQGEGDPWEAFEKDKPEGAAAIREAGEAWNRQGPKPALLEGAFLVGAHLNRAHLRRAHMEKASLGGAHLNRANLEDAHLNEAKPGGGVPLQGSAGGG